VARRLALLCLLGGSASTTLAASAYDPLEPINRPIYALNNTIDRFALKPLARGYDFIMPPLAQRGVGNFFANLYDVTSALNAVLQFRLPNAARSGGRVLVNSTVGIVGIFDVASSWGIEPYRTDFGQTLALWGLPEGPYLMLPLFGPRTVRSGAGTLVDTFTLSVPPQLDNRALRNSIWGLELVHWRARFLDTDELITGDRYIFVRDAYLQQRSLLVNDGEVIDEFSDFEDSWEDEDWDDEGFEDGLDEGLDDEP
jgi:phospholipid-binding lipoprotein MlaA